MEELTRVSVGLEEGADGAVLAHGLGLPGCAAAGGGADVAMAAFERALGEWLRFLAFAREPVPPAEAELEVSVDEWIRTDARVSAGESEALFAADLAPLADAEIDRGLRRLGALRGLLLARVRRLPDAELDRPTAGGTTVRRVLEELARAQWWTLSRLGATPMAGADDRTLSRLDTAMALVVEHFTSLAPERRGTRLAMEGEEWTPRKVLRRLLWLEWTMGRAAAAGLEAAPAAGARTPDDGVHR
jgi:predicted RNase H-like HicB family nuclease